MFNSPNMSISYELVDQGYDVWITNSRGSVYSNKHQIYNISQPEYWNFTMNEMGRFDLPANLRYILANTGFSQIIYVGHSQGCTQWIMGNSLDPSISSKYKAFIGIAPAAFVYWQNSIMIQTI